MVVKPIILPPSFAAPIWPSAGIGVGVLILWGYRYIPAILLGELIVSFDLYKSEDFAGDSNLYFVYAGLLLATILRSALGAYLVNNYLGKSNNFLTFQATSRLLIFAGLIPTFISSFLSVITLSINGLIVENSEFTNFLTWWFGDSIGVFIVVPFMFLLFKKPRNLWNIRLFKTAIPVVLSFSLLLLVAYNLKLGEQKRLVTIIDNKIELLNHEILAIFTKNNPVQEWLPSDQTVEKINNIFITNTNDLTMIKHLEDIHYIVYSVEKDVPVKIFESSNQSEKSKDWSGSKIFKFANHEWKIEAYVTKQFYYNNASWMIWWFLSIGFLCISLLGAGLFVMTGNNIIVREKVAKRTKEINTLNEILKTSEARYKQLVEIQPVIFWKHKVGEKNLEFLSSDAVKILGHPMRKLVNVSVLLNEIIHPDDRKKTVKEYYNGIKSNNRFEFKYRAITRNGEQIWFKDFVSPTKVNGKIELLGLKIDITKDQEKEQKIAQLAFYDSMTKLPNRIKFTDYLRKALHQSQLNDSFGAILYLDLDRFKVLNDSLGHKYGNKLLVKISKRIKTILKKEDVLSRFGGDEFVILLSKQRRTLESIQHDVKNVVENIQNIISKPFRIAGNNFNATFSMGISLFPYNSDSVEETIQQADIAMYHSKSNGKNTVNFFQESMQEQANKRLIIEKSLKIALIRHEFEMYYQPIFNEDKKILKFESLIRWNHPTEGLLTPDSFIHIAEETGFIIELSEWIIDNVFERINTWNKQGYPLMPVSINISLYQFKNSDIFNVLETISNRYEINKNYITLELTETIGIDDFDDALSKLLKLKNMGFKLAIDDFGTGYSSLHYLAQMPIDILKLDKIFVAKIGMGRSSDALIEAIILLARQLELSVIVEGVESEYQFDFLKNLGCHKFQGFLMSEALPANEIIVLMDDSSNIQISS
jgi:diguanylate cyclase (GGDEF)-like protein/PAS domain S-box-containing protein